MSFHIEYAARDFNHLILSYDIEAEHMHLARFCNPKMRGDRIIRYIVSTSATKQEGCRICGEEGPTWAADWRKTREACSWAVEHSQKHLDAGLLATKRALVKDKQNNCVLLGEVIFRWSDGWTCSDGHAPTRTEILRARRALDRKLKG